MKGPLACISNAGEMYPVALAPYKEALSGWINHARSVHWVPTREECQRASEIAKNEQFWIKGQRDVWLAAELKRIGVV